MVDFTKYQGTGNDFVLIDNRDNHFDANNINLVTKLCNRRFGIGADGLILICEHPEHDFKMVYFNNDGSQSLCGNGSRCAMHFARHLKIIEENARFMAYDGVHNGFFKDGMIHIKMNDMEGAQPVGQDYFLNTGSPHYVRFVEELESINVFNEGRSIRNSNRYKSEGTNVNFASIIEKGQNTVSVRTYERGVEGETLSCGTGVTAVTIAATKLGLQSPVTINVKGGILQVSFEEHNGKFKDVYLIGPAERVFDGSITV